MTFDKEMAAKYRIVDGTAYSVNTPQAVVDILEAAIKGQYRIRVYYGKNGKNFRSYTVMTKKA